jgi:pimeloyl-ACP methyl ester carboxylesterase
MNTTSLVNGMEMHYKIHGREPAEPLILLHDFAGAGTVWEHVFKEPPKGYRLVVPDLRGHGRSIDPSKVFTFQQSSLDVITLLDQLHIKRFSPCRRRALHTVENRPNAG